MRLLKTLIVPALMALALSGCSVLNATWTKPGASEREALADFKDCEYTAMLATAGGGGSRYDVSASIVAKGEIERACMRRKGYEW